MQAIIRDFARILGNEPTWEIFSLIVTKEGICLSWEDLTSLQHNCKSKRRCHRLYSTVLSKREAGKQSLIFGCKGGPTETGKRREQADEMISNRLLIADIRFRSDQSGTHLNLFPRTAIQSIPYGKAAACVVRRFCRRRLGKHYYTSGNKVVQWSEEDIGR